MATYTLTRTYDRIYAKVEIVPDDDPDLSWLDQTDDQMGDGFEQSARERIAAYNNGEWSMVGVVVTLYGERDGMQRWEHEEIAKASLWGIESDSEPSYFQEVANDLLASDLGSLLAELGINPADVELVN